MFLIEASHLSNLVPETFDVPSSGGLIESIWLYNGLFQRRAHNLGSPRFLCELWNLNILLNSLDCSRGICSMLSVLCWATEIHHFGSESNLRHLDCFISSSLRLWDVSLRRHAIVNNLVDELWLEKFSCFLRRLRVFMWWNQLHHLRRSLPKSAVAQAPRRSVRRFTLP